MGQVQSTGETVMTSVNVLRRQIEKAKHGFLGNFAFSRLILNDLDTDSLQKLQNF